MQMLAFHPHPNPLPSRERGLCRGLPSWERRLCKRFPSRERRRCRAGQLVQEWGHVLSSLCPFLTDDRSRRTHNRRRSGRHESRAGCHRQRRGRCRRHEGPPGQEPLERRAGRDQRRPDRPGRRLARPRLRHDQGQRLPGRPGRDRDHVPRGGQRGYLHGAHGGDLQPRPGGPSRHTRLRRPEAGPHLLRWPTSPARPCCTYSTSRC